LCYQVDNGGNAAWSWKEATMEEGKIPRGFRELSQFTLLAALFGRRSRRFAVGAEIPDGPLRFKSSKPPLPLSELERMLVLSAVGGNTGWHNLITRHARYAPHLANYCGAAGGRAFPSAAGFHTSEIFFTDDSGTYFFPTRDAPALVDAAGELPDLEGWLAAHRARLRRLSDRRLHIPAAEPYMEGHNTWCANRPGSLLVIPVGDIAQHHLLNFCFFVRNGYCIFDDVHGEAIPGMERFRSLVDVEKPIPLTFVEQYSLTECTAELATACYSGMLLLQAMGLGGWMFDGLDRFTVLGASGDPDVPGLGFRYDTDERWALPNPTGLPGVFEAFCPPHFPDLRAAVEALCRRKFGEGGPYHPDTPGPWRESARVRSSAAVHGDEFRECVALMAQYTYDRFGKFPGTVPTLFIMNYLQAHHLDLEFYDHYFRPGAYLPSHAGHLRNWHGDRETT
jgi:hypothetical protein